MIPIYYSRCSCGAITIEDNNISYSCLESNLDKFFPEIDLSELEELQTSYCCNHCVNHYGLDLCACGSGEPVGECDNGFDVCENHIPMQVIDKYTTVRSNSSWI